MTESESVCPCPLTRRRLLRRMRTLQLGMDGLVLAALALLGASVSTNPFNLVWQVSWPETCKTLHFAE